MKKLIVIFIICSFFVWNLSLLRFTENGAVKALDHVPPSLMIISSKSTFYGKAVIFKDEKTFGIAFLERVFGFMWKCNGFTYMQELKVNLPFETIWSFTKNKYGRQQYVLAVKVNDPTITQIGLINKYKGTHLNSITTEANPDIHVENVINNSVIFVEDYYNEKESLICGYNKNGNIIAYKLFDNKAVYVER